MSKETIDKKALLKEIMEAMPETPYPIAVFPMNGEEYRKAVPDNQLRTAISGHMARFGWKIAYRQITEVIENVLKEEMWNE